MTRTFDINLYDGHLIINDNDQKILVDTGSPVTIGRSDHFMFMDQEYNCTTALMGHDISSISEMMGYDIDVLMGMDVIGKYEMLTDYKSAKVTFSFEEIPFEPICTAPIIREMGLVFVYLRVKGNDAKLALDTGAKISYIDKSYTLDETEFEVRADFNPAIGKFETPIYAMEASVDGRSFPVNFGNLPSLFAMSLQMVGIEGAIGYDLFSAFKVLLDFKNNKMLLMDPPSQK